MSECVNTYSCQDDLRKSVLKVPHRLTLEVEELVFVGLMLGNRDNT